MKKTKKTYGETVGELHLGGGRPLEATGRPLIGATVVTVTTAAIAIWIGRRSCLDTGLLSEVDLRGGGSDLNLGVGLGAVVDRRGRHL